MLSVAVAGSSSAVQSFAAPILLLTALDLSTFNNNQHLQVTPSLASDPAQSSFLALRLIFPVPMALQLREKSKATPAKPESSKTDDERELFVEIHSEHVKPDDLWKNLLDTAGLEKVHEHTDQLASVFDFVNLATARRAIVALRWSDFTAGETGSWKLLQKELGINEKDHVDRTETLIRRAYFVRFPERDASVLTDQEMLVALGFPSAAEQIVATPQINWSTEIVQQGFDAEYQGHDLIVIPTLETLQLYAEIHWPAPSFQPCYTLYPSETNTEHDSALFLPNHRNSQGGV
ncbi:hypothetical protein PtA15_2A133 [Puccinia triticina]|uniref:Uncharacterized protein n=1 Tax=Puccinia triticina TaxID=208348 RepID=A0ABY7CCF0_9BASI|nr:uncharacterized protein PtA15_2A133 [Puccinia triticina]WAQ81821.1 hypothetical protein PtA15_2A133 [Puccinia triticina]